MVVVVVEQVVEVMVRWWWWNGWLDVGVRGCSCCGGCGMMVGGGDSGRWNVCGCYCTYSVDNVNGTGNENGWLVG